jgi:hypothetical protein
MNSAEITVRIAVDREALAQCCRKWRITELALFGSVLREDFGPASDVDALVTFAADAPWTLWDFAAIRADLAQVLGRSVDLLEKRALRNPFIRREVLATQVVVYAA